MNTKVDAESRPTERELRYGETILQCIEKARRLNPIEVHPNLKGCHRLISVTKQELEYQRKIEKLAWIDRPHRRPEEVPSTLAIEVSDELENRALRIMEALIRAIEAVGGRVEVRQDEYRSYRENTVVVFGNEEPLPIRLREKQTKIQRPKERAHQLSLESFRNLAPSGLLMIDRGASSYEGAILIESTTKPLESKLNWLVLNLLSKIGEQRIRRIELEEKERLRLELARQERERQEILKKMREDLERRQQAEQERVDDLIRNANCWRQAQVIRDFLDAVAGIHVPSEGSIPMDCSLAKYLKWGFGQADRIDPLREGPRSVLDETIEEDSPRPTQPR